MKPRIAIVVINDLGVANGTTVRARWVIDSLRKDYAITVLSRMDAVNPSILANLGIGLNQLRAIGPSRTRLWNLKILPILLKGNYDGVYCVADIFGFYTCYLLSPFIRFKVIYEAHALAHRERGQASKAWGFLYLLAEVFIAKKASAVISLSSVTNSFFGQFKLNVFNVPVSVNDGLRKQSNEEPSQTLVGLVGPFDSPSNQFQLEFLYKNLDRFDRTIKFLLIGKCHKRINSARVNYTGYFESSDAYIAALKKIDVLLTPVRLATFGPKNKILEAMALGIPVIATPEATVGLDFVDDGSSIILSRESELVERVNSVVHDAVLLSEVGLNGSRVVQAHYSTVLNEAKLRESVRTILAQ